MIKNKKTLERHSVDNGVLLYREETLSDGSLAYSIEGYRYIGKHGIQCVFEVAASGERNAATLWNALTLSTDIRFE